MPSTHRSANSSTLRSRPSTRPSPKQPTEPSRALQFTWPASWASAPSRSGPRIASHGTEQRARSSNTASPTRSTRPRPPRSARNPNQAEGRWEQLGAWRKAGESVLDARKQLDLDYGPVKERLARIEGLIPEADRARALDRGHGWEL
jgi:hypothetical protein